MLKELVIKLLKNKIVVASLIILTLLILFVVIYFKSYALPERVTEVNLSSKNADYSKEEPGSWNVKKSVKWLNKTKARITFELETIPKKLNNINCSDTVIILDTSNSLSENKLENIKEVTKETVNAIFKDTSIENRVGLITFNSSSNIVSSLTNNSSEIIKSIDNIEIGGNSKGDTNYYLALKSLDEVLNGTSCVKTAIIVADGYPNVGTPNEVNQFKYLKNKYNDLTISAIQYDMGLVIGEEIKQISDYQYSVNENSVKEAMIESSGLSVNQIYEELNITDTVNGEYFNIEKESIKNDIGKVTINENNKEVKWDIAGIKSGTKARMSVDIELKEEYQGENRDYATNTNERVISKIDNIEENEETTTSPILYRTYNVSYDVNAPSNCEVSGNFEDAMHGQYEVVEINTEEKPKCEGYKFKGWEIVTEDVIKYNDDYFEMPGKNVELRAEWGKTTINKNMDGEVYEYRQVDVEVKVINGTVDEEKKTITRDDTVTFEVRGNIGYGDPTVSCTNNGKASLSGNTLTVKNVQESTVCTVEYKKETYTITYNLNGGSVSGNPTSYEVDTPTFTLKNPSKTGNEFVGWTGSNGSTPQTSVTIPVGSTGNRSYTANWEPYKYTVEVEITNGNVSGESVKEINYGEDGTFTVTPNTGYHISNVTCTNNQIGSMNGNSLVVSNVTNDTVCTVSTDPNTYQVKYNANGGSGSMSNSTHVYDVSKALSRNTFTRTGYNFQGWSTSSTSSTVTYNDEESVRNLTSTNNGIVNLYAVWKIKSYTVNIVVNNGTVSGSTSKSVNYGSDATFTTVPTSPADRYEITSVSCTNGQSATYSGNNISVNDVDDNTTCTVNYTAKWTGIDTDTCVAGRTLSYAGLSWTVLGVSSGQCRLALNGLRGTGTYNNSKSYLTTNFLNTNATLKSEAANGALVSQSGSYVTTNSGSATGISSTSDATALYWIKSGTVRAGRTYYRYTLKSQTFYHGYTQARISNVSVSNITTSLYSGKPSQTVAITANTNLSVANTARTYTITNGVQSSSKTAARYATSYGRHRPQKSCVSNGKRYNSSSSRMRFRRQANRIENGVVTITQDWGCLLSWTNVRHSICGTSNDRKLVKLRAKDANEHYYLSAGSDVQNARYYYDNGSGWEYIFAGSIGGEQYNSTTYLYDHGKSGNCDPRLVYSVSNKTLNINYRPYIIVKTY